MVAHAEHAENDFASVFPDEHDFDASLSYDKEGVAGVVLEQNDASARIELLAGEVAEPLELDAVKAAEQRHRRQEVGRRGWRSRGVGERQKERRAGGATPMSPGEVKHAGQAVSNLATLGGGSVYDASSLNSDDCSRAIAHLRSAGKI